MQISVIKSDSVLFSERSLQAELDIIVGYLLDTPRLKSRFLLQAEELSLLFVNSAQMKKMNKDFRGLNYATDVLSFEIDKSRILKRKFLPSIGEIVICVPTLKKQARLHGLKQRQEFSYLFIHGILHLLGYDHEKSKNDEKAMYKIQDQLFTQLTGV